MTDTRLSRPLERDSSLEIEETINIVSHAPAGTTAYSTRSASKRPARPPSPLPQPLPEPTISTLAPNKHIQSSKNSVAPNYKLSSILQLVDTENYSAWRDISQYILEPFNCGDIVIGKQTMDTFEADDYDNFIHRYQFAATYSIDTLESQLPIPLTTYKTPCKR